jgi:hypothetical protein
MLILRRLSGGDRAIRAQNIESQELTAKIFWNRELGVEREFPSEPAVEYLLGELSRM